MIYPLKMVVFHSYVSLPEGKEKSHESDTILNNHPTSPGDFQLSLNQPL